MVLRVVTDYLNVMLSVVMLSVIMLSVIMLNVIMLSVIALNVIMLHVIMLSVVAPYSVPRALFTTLTYFITHEWAQ